MIRQVLTLRRASVGKSAVARRRRVFPITASATAREFASVFEFAKAAPLRLEAFDRIFDVYAAEATCTVGATLSEKYGVPTDSRQFVVSLRNKVAFEQTWFNAERANKPQNFTTTAALEDPTQNGSCDFCDPKNFTAVDDFGRVETPKVISASNLFKYCAPRHGLLVFRQHHPLEFDLDGIQDLMTCTQEWLERAAAANPEASYPLFVWNCLARSGASQFHGHAQVMLSQVPFPCYERLKAAQDCFASTYSGADYLETLFEACREVGLLMTYQKDAHRCVLYPSLTPWKDMEVALWSDTLTADAFCEALFTVLQTLMADFGMRTFNVGIQGIPLGRDFPLCYPKPSEAGSIMARWFPRSAAAIFGGDVCRVVSRGKLSSHASDFGGLEVLGGSSIGHTDPFIIKGVLNQKLKIPLTAELS